jgi:hypothetical protein
MKKMKKIKQHIYIFFEKKIHKRKRNKALQSGQEELNTGVSSLCIYKKTI